MLFARTRLAAWQFDALEHARALERFGRAEQKPVKRRNGRRVRIVMSRIHTPQR